MPHELVSGLREAAHLVLSGNPVIVSTTLRTLQLAVVATAIGAVVGVPCGVLLGLARSRRSRVLVGLANVLTRIPPVTVGLVVLLLFTEESPWGGGPLAALDVEKGARSLYAAQTLLAIPIVISLTASAVNGVPGVLLDQARAYGASRWRRGVLAAREARRRVMAGVIGAMGVTITTVGAIVVAGGPLVKAGSGAGEPTTLAVGALTTVRGGDFSGAPPAQTAGLTIPTPGLAVAYATILLGLFVLIAAALTWLQDTRGSLVGGLGS
jgi:tungstate transport system permease protein